MSRVPIPYDGDPILDDDNERDDWLSMRGFASPMDNFPRAGPVLLPANLVSAKVIVFDLFGTIIVS